jgi:hypothetical protein
MKKPHDIIITELLLVKADWHRTFVGEISRNKNAAGKEFIHGNVIVNEGKIWSSAGTQEELERNLDELCLMKLDMGLHSSPPSTIGMFNGNLYLN